MISLFLSELKVSLRTPSVLFWDFFFPLALYFVFGAVYGSAYIVFLLPGLIGITMVSLSLFKSAIAFVSNRQNGLFRMLFSAGIGKMEYFAAHFLVNFLLASVLFLVLIGLGRFQYDVTPSGGPFYAFVFVLSGCVIFYALGFLIGSLSANLESAVGAANFLFFGMLFLSGTYFPTNYLPPFLKSVSFALPLTHFLKIFRAWWSGLPLDAAEYAISLGIIAVWLVASIYFGTRKLRWEVPAN